MVSAPTAVLASSTACRRLPGPESLRLVTVNVAADALPAVSSAATMAAPVVSLLPLGCDFCVARSRARRCWRVTATSPSATSISPPTCRAPRTTRQLYSLAQAYDPDIIVHLAISFLHAVVGTFDARSAPY